MQNYPCVYVIILNWNNFADSKRCLQSLFEATYPNLKIIVVDNASKDGSGKQLQSYFPDLRFIFNDKNLGFARGCNTGIRAALEDERCAYVLLLNNDAIATPNFLECAVETAEKRPDIGMVGGKVLLLPEVKTFWYAGGHIDLWRGRVYVRGFCEEDRGQYDAPAAVGFVTGALALIKREVLAQVGLLPEEYFFGIEELDYSLAVMRAGYTLFYVPDFLVYHKADGSHSNYHPKYVYNGYRSKLILQEKYLSKPAFILWKLAFRFYARYLATRTWQRLRNEDSRQQDKRVSVDDMKFALRKAFKDHGKNMLSEETLARFEDELERRKRQLVGSHSG
jgi:GT2 family glycosyltransferase